MIRAILLVGGLGFLLLGVVVAADDARQRGQPVPAKEQSAPLPRARPGNSPLPTQIWWTGRENSLLVNESGTGRIIEVDSRTGKIVRPGASVKLPHRAFAAPAPNRKLWASIDPGRRAVNLFQGDFLEFVQSS